MWLDGWLDVVTEGKGGDQGNSWVQALASWVGGGVIILGRW